MRDPKRIDIILGQIKELWEAYPDMRFMQLLINIFGDRLPYYLEDSQVSRDLDQCLIHWVDLAGKCKMKGEQQNKDEDVCSE